MGNIRNVTTPIYYVNDVPHLGHAYTTIACDVYARFWKFWGDAVFFSTGCDEHGQKVAKSAAGAKQVPQSYVDTIAQTFIAMTEKIGAIPDAFIRTTSASHHQAAQAFWHALEASGSIYRGTYAGWYATQDEAYYSEDELVDGHAPTGAPVLWTEEPCYFFRLSAWGAPLLDYYKRHPEAVWPASRYEEVLRFLERGLRDLCISRSFSTCSWGIPIPGSSTEVMYVWVDALTNYLTALGYPNTTSGNFTTFWPYAEHVVGKDILIFHAVYWPAMLMATGFPLPKRIIAHGWWLNEGKKMSKSLGNTLNPSDLITTYGLDPLRYFLMREISFGSDGNFSDLGIRARYEHELANDLGNLLQRALIMVHRHFGGRVPTFYGVACKEDTILLTWGSTIGPSLASAMENVAFDTYLETVWSHIRASNQYFEHQAPWKLAKDPSQQARLGSILYITLETLRQIWLFLSPFMPDTSCKALELLGIQSKAPNFFEVGTPLAPDTSLPEPFVLFPKEEC